jgi:PAS domain S-box-containing protein
MDHHVLLHEFTDSFMNEINLGILLIDEHGHIIELSTLACELMGLERVAWIGRPAEELFRRCNDTVRSVFMRVMDGEPVKNASVRWFDSDKSYDLIVDSNLIRNRAGVFYGTYIMFKDVSHIKLLEAQVRQSDRLAMIGQVAAGAAHEIRNPLTSIKGFLQILSSALQVRGMMRETTFVEIMLKEIERINRLVGEMLVLSKPSKTVGKSVEISAVIQDILPVIQSEAVLNNISLLYQPAGGSAQVSADAEQLKQVILNLCKNGIEAMNQQGDQLTIRERVNYHEQTVAIEIHDQGTGIPAFHVDKMFDPFFTTKENGTGLGLAICRRIVHEIGGQIRVSSKGYGTIMTVVLPISSIPT